MHDIFVAFCQDHIVVTSHDRILCAYKPKPSQLFRIASVMGNDLYVISGDHDRSALRKLVVNQEGEIVDNALLIIIPENVDIREMFLIEDFVLVLVCSKCVFQLRIDPAGFVSRFEQYNIIQDVTINIESITYQDGFFYVLSYKWHDNEIRDTCDNFMYVYNDLWEFQQIYMFPLHTPCSQIRYFDTDIMFINENSLYKFNIVAKDACVCYTFQHNIKSYVITKDQQTICLLSNQRNDLACGFATAGPVSHTNQDFPHLNEILHTITHFLCMEDVCAPASKYKRSYVKKIYYPEPNLTGLVDRLLLVFENLEKVKHFFRFQRANNTCDDFSFESIDAFVKAINVLGNKDNKVAFPSLESKYPLQLVDYRGTSALIDDVYNHCRMHGFRPTGWFIYPTSHNMGWHTNLDNNDHERVKHRLYIAMNKAPFGSSFFLYIHPISKQVHVVPDMGVNIMSFSLLRDQMPLWHAVLCSDGIRMSFGLGSDCDFPTTTHV